MLERMQDKKLGTFFGIFIPNVTMMFGVIIFLRLSVVTGTIGFGQVCLIYLMSLALMLITSASTTMLASNMEVGAGGVYYIIARSLGLKIGGAVGLATFMTQILTISFCTTAFSYTIVSLFPSLSLTLVEVLTLILLTVVSSYSARAALKAQGFIMLILMIAIVSIIVGTTQNVPNPPVDAKPFFDHTFGFWQAFAVLYSALTGIEAGMALSGTLKNPSRSLKIGNPTSLIFVFVTYIVLAGLADHYFTRETLMSDPFLFRKISWPLGIVTVGVCAATISSALGAILGGPRILQSLSQDKITPQIFARTYGPLKEPRYAIIFTFIISLSLVLSTDIDQIIPIYTMICLINYGLLNLTAFISNKINAPSWRPTYRLPVFLPLIGFIMCAMFMFMISPAWGFTAITVVGLIYLLLRRNEYASEISGIRRSVWFWLMRKGLYLLDSEEEDISTWHPTLMVLSISPSSYPRMVKLAKTLTDDNGLLIFGVVLPTSWNTSDRLSWNKKALISNFEEQKVKCLVTTHTSDSPYQGFINLTQTHGIGHLEPNTMMLPITSLEDINHELLGLIKTCYSTNKNLLIYYPQQSNDISTHFNKKTTSKKVIDLWWNSEDRASTDLMMNFIEILSESSFWRRSKIYLNALAESDDQEQSLNDFLKGLVKLNRLKIKVRVHQTDKDSCEIENILDRSDKEDVTLQVLPAYDPTHSDEAYLAKLHNVIQKSQTMSSDCLFISKYDTIDHGMLLK
ncbi:MAG: hypothetical protein C0582_02865 [Alphaproteobacteria bacterium]|nr:MAG: hypothetical protein C0582_02865 [Alphaproteobacteria bacterium]